MATSRKKVKEAAGADWDAKYPGESRRSHRSGREYGYDTIGLDAKVRSGASPRAPKGSKKKTTHKRPWSGYRDSSESKTTHTARYGNRRSFSSHSKRL